MPGLNLYRIITLFILLWFSYYHSFSQPDRPFPLWHKSKKCDSLISFEKVCYVIVFTLPYVLDKTFYGKQHNTVLYGIGEPNDRSYPQWQLAHIMNKNDIIEYLKKKIGINHRMKRVLTNNRYINTVDDFEKCIKNHLPHEVKLDKLQFNPNASLKFNFGKMRSNLESNANDKKYETFLSDMKELGIKNNNFDEFFGLILANLYQTLKFNILHPNLVETQVYIDKYKAKRYQELLMLIEIKHPSQNKYYKYSSVFIVNHHRGGYTLNCINTASITMANILLATYNNKFDVNSWAPTMSNPYMSFYQEFAKKECENFQHFIPNFTLLNKELSNIDLRETML